MSIFSEPVFTLTEAAKRLPGRPHISTIHRWRTRGIHGIRLRTHMIGGRRMVALSDLEAFLNAVTAAADKGLAPTRRNSNRREEKISRTERQLADAGILSEPTDSHCPVASRTSASSGVARLHKRRGTEP